MTTPTLSIIIPTLNAGAALERCLQSISPRVDVEVIVVDGGSTDNTIAIAKQWADKLVHNPERIAECGKRIGLEEATGDYVCFMDADNELSIPYFIRMAIEALEADSDVIGLESYYPPAANQSSFCVYLTHLLHISDPVSWMMSVKPMLTEDRGDRVEVWRFPHGSLAYPLGANGFFFRREHLTGVRATERFEDTAVALRLARLHGFTCWLRIKGMGVHHHIVRTPWEFLRKRRRQTFHFLSQKHTGGDDSWTTYSPAMSPALACVACATLVVPLYQTVSGLIKSRNLCWLWHPLACMLSVAGIAWGYASYKLSPKTTEYESKLQPAMGKIQQCRKQALS